MPLINLDAVLNPLPELKNHILDYVPRATTSEFGIVALGSGINVDNFGRIYLDTQEYSDRLTAIETTAASTLETTVNTLEVKADELAASITQKLGTPNGIATLDSAGNIPSSQLPSYVDDVLEYLNVAAFPTTGVAGKIYVETTGNTTYRWGGTAYVKITSGEVSSVAGKSGVVTLTKADVGLANVDNTPDAQKPISEATQLALNDKVNKSAVIDITKGGTGATTVEGAKQSLGLQRFTQDEVVTSIFAPYTPAGDSRIVITKTGWGVWSTVPTFDPALPLNVGGTGARSAPDARTNLGLGTAATRNVGTAAGNVMEVGAFGLGGLSPLVTQPANVKQSGFYHTLNPDDMAYCAFLNIMHSGQDMYRWQLGAPMGEATLSKLKARIRTESGWSSEARIWNQHNTTVDSNGFIKAASPVVNLFSDKFELNNEAKEQPITFEKLGVGVYLIKGSTGLALEGWYIEQPKDSNGNIFHAVEYGTHNNGDIWIKTYEQIMEGTRIVADHTRPVDIKEDRFISIRLNELPKDTSAPINPTIVDNEGNPAPSRLHELEEGVWVISEENAAILEQERLAAMKPLKRRQFRLTLAMNGYDLNEIEALIDQIEDPMQRTIAQIEWQDATDFERTNPTLLMMAQMLGLTSEQIDSLWEYGLAL